MYWNPEEINSGISQENINNLNPKIKQAMIAAFQIQLAMDYPIKQPNGGLDKPAENK
jgi:hypothetical protein